MKNDFKKKGYKKMKTGKRLGNCPTYRFLNVVS